MSVDWCVLLYIIHTQAGGGGVGGGNVVDGMMGTVANDVQTQELAAKISENAQLHLQVSFSWYVSTLYRWSHCCHSTTTDIRVES